MASASAPPEPSTISKTGKSFIAMARWMAALVVVLAHLRAILFVGWDALPAGAHNIAVATFYALTSFSHEAVIVFFVLSGFLVGGVNFDRALRGRFDAGSYGIDRFTRIYVTLLPALVLTVVADQVGMRMLDWTGYYDGTNPLMAERFVPAIQAKQGASIFLGNLFMIQPVYVPVLGSNFPLWSLSYEVWFYFWFGLLASAAISKSWLAKALLLIGTLALGWLFQWLALFYLAIWCLGIIAALWPLWPKGIVGPLVGLCASFALAASGFTDMTVGDLSINLSDIPLSISFAWLLHGMKDSRSQFLDRMEPANQRLSDFSYSLYVIHFPLILLVSGALSAMLGLARALPNGLVPTDARSGIVYIGTVAVVVLAAFCFSWLFERRTPIVRRWLKQLTLRRPGSAADSTSAGRQRGQ